MHTAHVVFVFDKIGGRDMETNSPERGRIAVKSDGKESSIPIGMRLLIHPDPIDPVVFPSVFHLDRDIERSIEVEVRDPLIIRNKVKDRVVGRATGCRGIIPPLNHHLLHVCIYYYNFYFLMDFGADFFIKKKSIIYKKKLMEIQNAANVDQISKKLKSMIIIIRWYRIHDS
jgi:hypothetical protein